jgi:hypothetical protein
MKTSIITDFMREIPRQFLMTVKECVLILPIVYLTLWTFLIALPEFIF